MGRNIDLSDYYDIGDIFSNGDIIEYVSNHMDPDDVFNDDILINWAIESGFTKFDSSVLSSWAIENGFTKKEE